MTAAVVDQKKGTVQMQFSTPSTQLHAKQAQKGQLGAYSSNQKVPAFSHWPAQITSRCTYQLSNALTSRQCLTAGEAREDWSLDLSSGYACLPFLLTRQESGERRVPLRPQM